MIALSQQLMVLTSDIFEQDRPLDTYMPISFSGITVEDTAADAMNWMDKDWEVFNQGRQNHYMYHKNKERS